MWFPTPEQVKFAAETAGTLYRAGGKDFVIDLLDAIWRGKPTFIVFGPGGTGKSTLKKFLETLSEDPLDPKYSMSLLWEPGKIKGRPFSNVTVFPGQPDYRENQIKAHRSWLQGIRRPFIVLCFSYGYRSVDAKQRLSRDAPQANAAAREEELSYAKEILGELHLLCGFRRYTIFSIILKQDLWWDERDDVIQFYETQYEPIIDKFSKDSVGKENVLHHVFPMCLIRSSLRDAAGGVIKVGAGSYEEATRREHTAYFLATLRSTLQAG